MAMNALYSWVMDNLHTTCEKEFTIQWQGPDITTEEQFEAIYGHYKDCTHEEFMMLCLFVALATTDKMEG